MTTESVYQHKILLPFITAPISQGGLGWTMPAAGSTSSNAIDPATGILWADTLDFLRSGNSANAVAWGELVAAHKKAGGAQDALARAEAAARQALVDRMNQVDTVLEALRRGVVVDGVRFSLWNRKPSTGDSTIVLGRNTYAQNTLRATPEVPVMGQASMASMLGGKAGKAGFVPRARVDLAFHLNGIPLGYLEVKSEGSDQCAKLEGRRQLAEDFIAFAVSGLVRLYSEFETSEGRAWQGLNAGKKILTDAWKRRAMNVLPLWFGKVAWRATCDMKRMFLAGSAWDCLKEVDAALMEQIQAQQTAKSFDWSSRHRQLVDRLMQMSGELPPVLLDKPNRERCGWDQPRAHLEALLGTIGLDQEIQLFGHPTRRKDSKQIATMELIAPRTPQRVALGQIQRWAGWMYSHEAEQDWIEKELRGRLAASMPGLSMEEVEQRVGERLRFRNGQEAYSIVVQGAAGVGKTNLATWVSLTLHGMLETDPTGSLTSQPMFDYIVVLTDRVELRKNIADSAELNKGSRGMVTEINTTSLLERALEGRAPKGTGRILVVNLHKFPALLEKIQRGETTIKRNGGRIAFIIDEVHRSNQGKLNSKTQDAFLEQVGALGAQTGAVSKKNLIIGLTATPTDPILARFGLWRSGSGAGDPGAWTPHFAYGMDQAIEDGYVLNPLAGLMRAETVLDIDEAATMDAAGGHSSNVARDVDHLKIYEHPEYQKKAAEAFAKVFVTSTMPAMRDNHNTNLVGRGKAMVTVPSVKAAIGMQEAIRKALLKLARKSKGTPWERYAHIVKDVANKRTFILYSDPGRRATVAQREDTGIDGGCGPLNPLPTLSDKQNKESAESQIINGFRCKGAESDGNARNSIIVVVDKLLTGFDEDTLHTLMIARNLQGVGLLQTMCRVNRTRAGKDNCLVIDASYDPDGEGLGPEAVRVFKRYGGLTASRLDGLGLLERVIKQRLDLMKNRIVANGWKDWKKAAGDEAGQMRVVSLVASDIKEGENGHENALALRRMVGGYLAQQVQADPIMQLDKKDRDPDFLAYLYRLHKHLKVDEPGVDRIPVQFTVRDVDFTAQEFQVASLTRAEEKRDTSTHTDVLEKEFLDESSRSSKDFDLSDLQAQQERKAEIVDGLRRAIKDMCAGIDEVASGDDVMARLRSDLIEQRLESAEASDAFRKLVAAVKVRRVRDSKGRQVVWLDQVSGRREIISWLGNPHRMGFTMGAWMETLAVNSMQINTN